MKIDQDLRIAIRSAERCQPDFGYRDQLGAEKVAISNLIKARPVVGSQVRRATRRLAVAAKSQEIARKILGDFGLRDGGERIWDEDKFVKAGGKLPGPQQKRWKFDCVMKELAAADPKQARSILKRYGINWS